MKKFLVLVIGVLMSVVAFAHAPLISVDDNGDGTVLKVVSQMELQVKVLKS